MRGKTIIKICNFNSRSTVLKTQFTLFDTFDSRLQMPREMDKSEILLSGKEVKVATVFIIHNKSLYKSIQSQVVLFCIKSFSNLVTAVYLLKHSQES